MKTQCSQRSFGFHALGAREVVGRVDGGQITSDGGGLLSGVSAMVSGLVVYAIAETWCTAEHTVHQLGQTHKLLRELLKNRPASGIGAIHEDRRDGCAPPTAPPVP